jgi:hypothetical protein
VSIVRSHKHEEHERAKISEAPEEPKEKDSTARLLVFPEEHRDGVPTKPRFEQEHGEVFCLAVLNSIIEHLCYYVKGEKAKIRDQVSRDEGMGDGGGNENALCGGQAGNLEKGRPHG